MMNDVLANALALIQNAGQSRKMTCVIAQSSRLTESVLAIMHEHHYLGEVTKESTAQGTRLRVSLLNTLNRCGAIKPRFSVRQDTFETFERRFLPARDFGILILTTPKGVMTHHDAKKQGVGGRLIAYCY